MRKTVFLLTFILIVTMAACSTNNEATIRDENKSSGESDRSVDSDTPEEDAGFLHGPARHGDGEILFLRGSLRPRRFAVYQLVALGPVAVVVVVLHRHVDGLFQHVFVQLPVENGDFIAGLAVKGVDQGAV